MSFYIRMFAVVGIIVLRKEVLDVHVAIVVLYDFGREIVVFNSRLFIAENSIIGTSASVVHGGSATFRERGQRLVLCRCIGR